ncbi:hypothetical protein PISL3812_09929 [Talaromyces islandicus]|uniref:Uncharacterized protein n=1 Tax=Talaromyces islandicus TaxID=28573 RepID=A0A0U1MD33_TALIS|nr:hypothetical protein PISL3812_09929 [Talaromyces islandicus]
MADPMEFPEFIQDVDNMNPVTQHTWLRRESPENKLVRKVEKLLTGPMQEKGNLRWIRARASSPEEKVLKEFIDYANITETSVDSILGSKGRWGAYVLVHYKPNDTEREAQQAYWICSQGYEKALVLVRPLHRILSLPTYQVYPSQSVKSVRDDTNIKPYNEKTSLDQISLYPHQTKIAYPFPEESTFVCVTYATDEEEFSKDRDLHVIPFMTSGLFPTE